MISQEHLKELLAYNPDTGWFTNLTTRGPAKAGERAGSPTGHGYRRIVIYGVKYYEHDLAWFYIHGEWPGELDHEDRTRDHNWISNLRPATRTQNCCNSERMTGSSGLKGAYLDDRVQRWYSKIQFGGKVKWLGHFDTAEEAHKAFMAAAENLHGEFLNPPPPQPTERTLSWRR